MPVLNRMAELHDEITEWRQTIHANPELMYDVHETAALVEKKLSEFGCDEVVTGIGKTGVVGIIEGKKNTKGHVIGLRADMDALPIEEATKKPYASKNSGKMHACGHDGHTAMLLGAAKYLCETRNFDGQIAVIFQPAEEGGAGGRAMVEDGMMERFNIQEVYGLHNYPAMAIGEFGIRTGPVMAATDDFHVTIKGKGAHAAMPHLGIDPVVIAAQLINAFQSIISRSKDPFEPLVISTTIVKAGAATNVIPNTVELAGTIRSLSEDSRKLAASRMQEIGEHIGKAADAEVSVRIDEGYPVTVNHAEQTERAARVAEMVCGEGKVDRNISATMGGEDFAFMLNARPGAFIFMGNGDTASLHHPEYDFNDEAIPFGTSYWAKLAETLLPTN